MPKRKKVENNSQITIRQHYVPQFYLRKFQNDSGEVEVLDCKNRKILSPRSTSSVCYSKYFYAVETGVQDDISQLIEDALGQMENSVANNLDSITQNILNQKQITTDEKWIISLLMSMLWLRGPYMRNQITTGSEDILKQVNEKYFHMIDTDKWFEKFDKETGNTTAPEFRKEFIDMMQKGDYSLHFSNANHLQMLDTIPNFANLFCGQNWRVYINESNLKFVTSDNPLVETNPDKPKTFWGFSFLERIHYFALNPNICIVAEYPTGSIKTLRRKTLTDRDFSKIMALNLMLSGRSNGFAYASDVQPFNAILDFVKFSSNYKE